MAEQANPIRGLLWSKFHKSSLWNILKRIAFLRSGYYLLREVLYTARASAEATPEALESVFAERVDPWSYETDAREQERFALQTSLIDQFRGAQLFPSALEIGCAEGLFTEIIADRSESLLVLDLSLTAMARAQGRRRWPQSVRFEAFDLRKDPIPGKYDLIVVAGVVEYFSKRKTLADVRKKLATALNQGGYLLVETTRKNPVVENAWFGKAMILGRWMNSFIAKDPSLLTVSEILTESFAITLLRKVDAAGAR